MFEHFVKALTEGKSSAADLSAEDRETVRERLVRLELVAQQAEKDGLASDAELASRIELSRLNILQTASAQKFFKEHPPTEAELRAEFETQIASMPLVEYHARHILVSGPDVAQKVIDQLNRGTSFDDLAKRLSTDKNSAVRGGDLGWFPPNQMPPSFADAIALLKKGEYTKTPVQTPAGWHVIQLLGTRDRPPPTFEAAAGAAQADRAHQEVHRLRGRTGEGREDHSAAGDRARRPRRRHRRLPAPAAPAAPAATTPAPAPTN